MQITQQRTLWTAWGEIVRDEGWMSIPDKGSNRTRWQPRWEMGDPYAPAMFLPFTLHFCSIFKHCFSIAFVVIWNAFVCNKYSSIVAFIGNRGEANIFLSNLRKTFFDKVQNNSLRKMIVRTFGALALLLDLFDFFDHFWPFLAIFSHFLAIFSLWGTYISGI